MSELDDILSKIYVEVPELPNKVIGLSRNMIADVKVALLKLIYEARLDELARLYLVYGSKTSPASLDNLFSLGEKGEISATPIKDRIKELKNEVNTPELVEVITRYEGNIDHKHSTVKTTYSVDGGMTFKPVPIVEDMKSISKYDLSEQTKLHRYNQHHAPGISSDTKFDDLGVDGDYDGS